MSHGKGQLLLGNECEVLALWTEDVRDMVEDHKSLTNPWQGTVLSPPVTDIPKPSPYGMTTWKMAGV